MNRSFTQTLIVSALTIVACNAANAGALDAPEPVVRDYSKPMKIEPGYMTREEIARDIRGIR
ncbi:hypothetical protein FG152_24465 [Ochrobactrum sp. XJ1]|nr:hypothetical protein [Ochrobactrum sp. XJ1]